MLGATLSYSTGVPTRSAWPSTSRPRMINTLRCACIQSSGRTLCTRPGTAADAVKGLLADCDMCARHQKQAFKGCMGSCKGLLEAIHVQHATVLYNQARSGQAD